MTHSLRHANRLLVISLLPLTLLAGCAGAAASSPAVAAPAAAAPAPAAVGSQDGSASELIDKLLAAYGGKAALDAIHALRMSGTVVSPMRGKGELTRELERPDRLRVEVKYAAAREVRLLDGAKAWQNGKPASGVGLDAMAMQALRLDLPDLFSRMREQVKELPRVERGGVSLIALHLALDGGKELLALLDPATFHIARSESTVGPAGERLTFATNYSDFRSVSGVLFAFSEENFAGTMNTGQTRFEKIELLPSLPAETWNPPEPQNSK